MAFYTYIDWTLEASPRPFYVGKGNEARMRNPERNRKHRYVRSTFGYRREVVLVSNNETECFRKEVELIAEHHTFVNDEQASDVACNFTRGGEGVSGWHPSEKTRKQISETLAGRTRSIEHRENISNGKRGKSVGRGRKQTQETVQKRVETMRQNKANHKSKQGKTANKLNWLIAPVIRERYLAGESAVDLAIEYGVTPVTIRNVGNGVSYKP